ncbi:MAG: carbohydrate kinase family protein [Anaerolineae bacterium]|nr:carbohydrate kinase family protein [Anaerolineae bacterium]
MLSNNGPIVVVGTAAVDLITCEGDSHERRAGGSGANIAVGLAALGMDVCFIGGVGDDDNGHFIIDDLQQHDVNTAHMVVLPELETGIVVSERKPTGEFAWKWQAAPAYFALTDNHLSVIEGLRPAMLHLGAIPLLGEPGRSALCSLAAHWTGRVPLYFSTSLSQLRTHISRELLQAIRHTGALADVVFTSYGDNAFLGLKATGTGRLLYTRGERGAALLGESGETASVPGHSVEVVNTEGAGDTFASAFMAARVRGLPEAQALAFANAAAALSITGQGVRNMPAWGAAAHLAGIA